MMLDTWIYFRLTAVYLHSVKEIGQRNPTSERPHVFHRCEVFHSDVGVDGLNNLHRLHTV